MRWIIEKLSEVIAAVWHFATVETPIQGLKGAPFKTKASLNVRFCPLDQKLSAGSYGKKSFYLVNYNEAVLAVVSLF